MIKSLSITAIVENTVGAFEVAGEWGLALWIQADEQRPPTIWMSPTG